MLAVVQQHIGKIGNFTALGEAQEAAVLESATTPAGEVEMLKEKKEDGTEVEAKPGEKAPAKGAEKAPAKGAEKAPAKGAEKAAAAPAGKAAAPAEKPADKKAKK